MADEDRVKAEKLAAARKRVELLKKRGAGGKKKGKAEAAEDKKAPESVKKPSKELTEATDARIELSDSAAYPQQPEAKMEVSGAGAETGEAVVKGRNGGAKGEGVTREGADMERDMPAVTEEGTVDTIALEPHSQITSAAKASHSRAASFSASRDLKNSLRRPSISSTDILRSSGVARSPHPLSPGEAVPDIYRKQAQTISELTEANEKLEAEVEVLREQGAKLVVETARKDELVEEVGELKGAVGEYKRGVEELEQLREKNLEEMEKLNTELATANRQVSLLTSQLSLKDKTISDLRSTANSGNGSTADDTAVLLKSKEDLIELMEMEISKLRLDLEKFSKPLTDAQSRATMLEGQLSEAERTNIVLTTQIDELKQKLEKAAGRLVSEGAARESAEAKLRVKDTQVEKLEAGIKKLESQVASWEKDHSTLKHLYKETDSLAQSAQARVATLESQNEQLDKSVRELRTIVTKREPGSMQSDDDMLDTLEENELSKSRRRIRELETLLEDSHSRASSTNKGHHHQHRRKNSEKAGFTEVQFLGNFPTFEGDDDFLPSSGDEGDGGAGGARMDPAVVRAEEEKRRQQRTKEIKKELEQWRGHRLDLTNVPGRGTWGATLGQMFEI